MELEKSNKSVRVTGKVSPLQHKVFNGVLHSIRAQFKQTDLDGFEPVDDLRPEIMTIPFEWIVQGDATRGGNTRKDFEKSIKEIMNIDFREVDGSDITVFHAIEFVRYNWESRRIITRPTRIFHDLCKEHYKNGGFVSLPISELLPLMSTYSLKFYELFKQLSEVGRKDVVKPVDWLREWLSIGTKYKLFSDFRKWVLEPARDEINEKTNLRYEFELVKRGRVVESVRFYGIEYRSAVATVPALPAPAPAPEFSESEKLLISAGVDGSAVQQIAQLYPDPAFIRSLIQQSAKAKSPAGFIVAKAGEKWREWEIKQSRRMLAGSAKIAGNASSHNRTPEKIENDRKQAEIAQKRVLAYESLPESLKNAVRAYKKSPEGGGVLFLSDPHVYAAIADRLQFDPVTGQYAIQQDFTEIPTRGMGAKNG